VNRQDAWCNNKDKELKLMLWYYQRATKWQDLYLFCTETTALGRCQIQHTQLEIYCKISPVVWRNWAYI